jgi:hypothetical protein
MHLKETTLEAGTTETFPLEAPRSIDYWKYLSLKVVDEQIG